MTSHEERPIFSGLTPAEESKWESLLLRLIVRPRTRKELYVRLRQRGCPEEKADELLDRFQDMGLVDDRTYALLYMDSKKNYGLRRLYDDLRARGVSREDIEAARDQCEIDEARRAFELVRQWRSRPGMTPEKLRARLCRRGFTNAAVNEALECLTDGDELF
ncbi:MAG: regulatory protein RecX [Pyramidobacter sp.]|jgi:regulatory protein